MISIFFNHFPARGWKLRISVLSSQVSNSLLFQSFPRKGMETKGYQLFPGELALSFSIISPQGDGN